ncbi:hypothetical protein QFZ27_003693 [Inquilinus ginsengisoli]
MAGQQAPEQRLGACWRRRLTHFEQGQGDLLGKGGGAGGLRAGNRDRAGPEFEFGHPGGPVGSLANGDAAPSQDRPGGRGGIERAPARQFAVMEDPAEHMDVGFGDRRPEGVEVGFAIGDHGHGRGRRQHRLGRLRGLDPMPRLLLRQGPAGIVLLRNRHTRLWRLAAPQAAADQAETRAGPGIERDHRVQQQAPAHSFADRAQSPIAAFAGPEVQRARVLDRQDMPARNRRCRALAPTGNKALHRYPRMTQQPAEADLDCLAALG